MLAGQSVVVAGAGGNIGSHLVSHLARMPEIARLVLVDRDCYETRNLQNQEICLADVGRPKVQVQSERLSRINPGLNVLPLHQSLEDLPMGRWRSSLVLACLDSLAARQAVNERAHRLGIPWIDSGVLGSECLARINVYLPGGGQPCLECAWSEGDYRRLEQQYPCGAGQAAPPSGTTSGLGALAAALLALECQKVLRGELACVGAGRQVTVDARRHGLSVTSFRRNTNCRFDHAIWPVEPLSWNPSAKTIADVLKLGDGVSVPGQRFIKQLICPGCGIRKRLFRLACSLAADAKRCGNCGRQMAAPGFEITETVSRALPDSVLTMTLADAGIRRGEVLVVGGRYLEIDGDSL